MKPLLFDQNLSPRLVNLLADIYPGCVHVDSIGLPTARDREIGSLVGIRLLTFLAVLLKFPVGILITFGLGGIALAISFNQS